MLIQFPRLASRAGFTFFALVLSLASTFSQSSVELCDNGADDDGDGLIDVYDPNDCPGLPLEFCTDTVRSHNFAVQLAWAPTQNLSTSFHATPIVGNLNPAQDSVPEIVLVSANPVGSTPSSQLLIFKGDGSNQSNPNQLTVAGNLANNNQMGVTPTIADLDGDGNPELIVLCADRRIRIYQGFDPAANPCMSLWVTATDTCLTNQFDVYAADFDNDGISELYAGHEVYTLDLSIPAAPVLRRRLRGGGPMARTFWTGLTPLAKASSYAADLLSVSDCNGDPDCAGLELAAGYVIYSVDLDPNDGDGYQIKVKRNINTMSGEVFEDGMTTVADVNLDGIQEVLVTSRKGAENGFYVWNKTGYWRFFKSSQLLVTPSFLVGTKMVVGNVYDDRVDGFAEDYPEILAGDEDFLHCFNLNRASVAPATPYWWELDLVNNAPGYNGMHTPALFDFDQDGWSELVVNGLGMAVLYGGAAPFPAGVNANREMMLYANAIGTQGIGSPAVADVDADGQAEIAAVDFVNSGNNNRLHVFEAEELQHSTWPSARQLWNQYAYTIVNVDDDLGIPQYQQAGQIEIPGPGSDYRPLNIFNAQLPYYGLQHPKHLTTADAVTEVLEVVCLGNLQFRVKVRVCNQGSVALPANLPLTFYRGGNPNLGPATKISTHTISPAPILPGGCAELTVVLQFTGGNVYAIANDPGLNVFPIQDSDEFWKAECDYANNTAVFKMNPSIGPSLSLGPDIHDCQQGQYVLQASPGFASYTWQNNTTGPSFVANGPGTYWVTAQDFCMNIRRDTIQIIADTVLRHVETSACQGSTYTFDGVAIAAGNSQSFVYTSATGCDSTIVVTVNALPVDQTAETIRICPGDSILVFGNMVMTAGAYSQQFLNNQGCDSIHTITVDLYAAPVPTQESRNICPGDSTLVFGTYVSTAGTFSQQFSNANGCDSTHTITVSLLPAPVPTQESRSICPGDSTLVFGTYVSTAGAFSQQFSNANGCDSTHTITVNLLPAPVPTQESRSICPGDSTLVFGTYVSTAGTFSQQFSNANGCDSTHTITVSLLPAPVPTQESRSICPGDSTLVFGTYVSTAGTFSQQFSNANGCDSTHTITVSLLPAPVPTQESRSICPGDSTLVFGTYVSTAGTFSQQFSNANGCDSTHTITVSLLPAPVPTQESRSICPGDSTLVFGTYVSTAGAFSQQFSNANGCDSTHTITVSLLPAPVPTQESRSICPGDSTLVFGTYVSTAGAFSQQFSNANGCDSTHTITVSLLPAPVPTQESRSICPGDSTLVFGTYVSTAGAFSQQFSNLNGCDSTHTITVSLLPAPVPTQESRSICPGDSTLVFGTYVSTAGAFSQQFSNANGCDSTHTITVSLLPAPVPTQESRSICPGDSTLVFGTYVSTAGAFSQQFSNANGCDSTHTVTVVLYSAPTNTFETRALCPGDSTWVFGAYVDTPGMFEQTFSNTNGCDSTHTIEITEAFLIERNDTLPLCPGDSVRVFDQWVQVPGTMQQIFPGSPGCDTLYTVVVRGIMAPAIAPVIQQPGAQQTTGSISVPAGTGALYSLDPSNFGGQTLFDNLPAGQYVLYQQFENCVQELPFEIERFSETTKNELYAPNALLPDSGNGNDAFTLYAPADRVNELVYLRIYDRWGALVFEREHFAAGDGTKGWNGYVGNQPASPGVYIWQAMVEWQNGEQEVKKGDLTVLR